VILKALAPIFFLIGCPAEAPKQQLQSKVEASSSRKLTILATGDVGSDTDVCGCKVHQMGGIARRAKAVKDRSKDRTIVVDAGDLFFRTWSISPTYLPQSKATADFMADSAKQMGDAAIAVGKRDLALGIGELRKLQERSGVPLLSANLIFAKSSTPAFDAFVLVERQGMKIGLVGASPELTPKMQAQLVYQQNGLTTQPLRPAIEAAAKAVRAKGAEVVIALLHLDPRQANELLTGLDAGVVDVSVIAHDRTEGNLTVGPQGRSAWIHAGSRGKWLAAIELELAKDGTGFIDIGVLDQQKKSVASIDERLAAYAREDAGTPERAATIDRLRKRKQQMQAELDNLALAGKHKISGAMIPLDTALPEDPEMLAAYRAFQSHLIEVNRGERPVDRAELEYTGSESCKACHLPMYKQWAKSGHAKAWETMVRTRQTGNLDCVPCHVTGFDRRGGPTSIMGLEKFVNVGCESCHGPGSAHVKNVKVAMDYGKLVPEQVCAECHRAQEDQKPFDFEARLPKVRH
jgi:2',3'-cyclic-nucleotide 2'-phosphodiesterase (5'-nucleotidase family)